MISVMVDAWVDVVGIVVLVTAVTLDAWTDVVGIVLLVIAIVSAASIDRSVMLRRAVGMRAVTIAVVSTVALVAVVVGRFIGRVTVQERLLVQEVVPVLREDIAGKRCGRRRPTRRRRREAMP